MGIFVIQRDTEDKKEKRTWFFFLIMILIILKVFFSWPAVFKTIKIFAFSEASESSVIMDHSTKLNIYSMLF